jgi:recombination protein RecT
MPGELAIIEHQLTAVAPRLSDALGRHMPVKQLIQTVLVSCERTPALFRCTPQSILNTAMSAAVLGLPVDGVTGQAFPIPYKGSAQLVIGYKGYNTLAARAGLTITAGTVREDDAFEYELGSHAFIRHRPVLGSRARIIAFYACATANDRPVIPAILSLDEVMAIHARSPGARSQSSPWNDPEIGFPAMGEKSARRRLARSTPLRIDMPQFQLAARMEEAFDEQGKLGWITPERGLVLEDDPAALALPHRQTETPTMEQLIEHQSPMTGEQGADDVAQRSDDRRAAPTDTMIESFLKDRALEGTAALQLGWSALTKRQQHQWAKMKDLHFKPMAAKADARKANADQETVR